MSGRSTQLPSASSIVRSLVSTDRPRTSLMSSRSSASSVATGCPLTLCSTCWLLTPRHLVEAIEEDRPLTAGDDTPDDIGQETELRRVEIAEKLVIDDLRPAREVGDRGAPARRQRQEDAAPVGRARPLAHL